jgi:hypothetical protein
MITEHVLIVVCIIYIESTTFAVNAIIHNSIRLVNSKRPYIVDPAAINSNSTVYFLEQVLNLICIYEGYKAK